MSEQRLEDLESRLAHQEDTINKMSDAIYLQQKRIDKLELQMKRFVTRLQEVSEAVPSAGDSHEPPPHY